MGGVSMYGFKKPLSKESILEYISEWDIFCAYIKELTAPDTSFQSELRESDNNPSCRVTNLSGGLRYKDFGDAEKAMDCFQYAKQYFQCHGVPINSFMDVLEQIRYDFELNDIEPYHKGRIPTQNMLAKNTQLNQQYIPKARQPYIITIKSEYGPWTTKVIGMIDMGLRGTGLI